MANLKNNLKKPFWLSLAPKEKVIFAQHLASMLDAGIPLHEALSVLKDQIAQPSLKYVIDVALIDLADGLPLHVSFGKFPKFFFYQFHQRGRSFRHLAWHFALYGGPIGKGE